MADEIRNSMALASSGRTLHEDRIVAIKLPDELELLGVRRLSKKHIGRWSNRPAGGKIAHGFARL